LAVSVLAANLMPLVAVASTGFRLVQRTGALRPPGVLGHKQH